jgi:CheY-like chemotaxis protein
MPQVLIVEDDPALRNLYDTIFKRDGFDVLTAADGQEGLEMALTKKPHFILLDMMLPKMNGMQVFEKILADPVAKNIPVIFLSNDTDPAEREKALQLGARDYIAKAKQPPEEIVNRVKKDLGLLAD